jgi:hypothetical protein
MKVWWIVAVCDAKKTGWMRRYFGGKTALNIF